MKITLFLVSGYLPLIGGKKDNSFVMRVRHHIAKCNVLLVLFLCVSTQQAFAQYPWNDQVITPNTYAPTPAITAASGGSDMVFNGGNQIFYIGTDQQVHNYWRDANTDWQENILSASQPAIPNSGLAVDLQSRIYYVGTDGYIYQLNWPLPSGPWSATKLNTFTSGSFMAARNNSRLGIYNISATSCRIFYVATDNFLHFVEKTSTGWTTGILSSNPQAVSSSSNFAVENTGRIFYINSGNQVSNAYPNGPMYVEFPLSFTGSPARPFTGLSLDPTNGVYYIASTTQRIHKATWAAGPGWTDVVVNSSSLNVKPATSFTLNNGQLMYTTSTGLNYVIYNNGSMVSQLTTPPTLPLSKSSWGTKDGLAYYFDASGKLHQLTPNIPVSNITTSGVLHEKFEIGVDLPANLDTDIDNFCNNAHLPGPYPVGAKNPYDPDQIRVKATYTDPSNKKYTRYGFFYRDVNIVDAYNYNISATLNAYPFRIRIAPEATGTWTVNVELYVNNVLTNSTTGTFSVASSSRKGPLTLLPGKYFKDFNGNDFFIVGQNTDITPPKQSATAHTEYWPASGIPASFTGQRNAITDLASKNANFIRWRITPWTYELEGAHSHTQNLPFRTLEKNLNNYDTRQHYAWEMDQTVITLEQNNMYSMLTLFYDPFWVHTDNDWFGNPEVTEQSHYEYNPYSTYDLSLTSTLSPSRSFTDCNPGNHAAITTSINNFFNANTPSSPRFRNIQKKMFYIMARWGYSPNIAVWQINNEADMTGNIATYPWTINNGNSMYAQDSPLGFRTALETWTTNVNYYLQTFYPKKTSMNGYGAVGTGWSSMPNPSQQSSTQDICSFNSYPDGVGDYYPEFLTHAVYKKNPVNRPFLQSEHGFVAGSVDWCSEYESHKRVWSGTFTGALGTPLLFWDQYQENGVDHRTKFTHIADLFASLNTIVPNYLNAVNWTPEATNITGLPHPEPGYSNSSVKRETNFYLRSSNQNTVVGWLNNYGYNWWSLRLANQLNDDPQVTGWCASDLYTFTPPTSYATYDFDENGLYDINATTNFSGTSIEPFAQVIGLKVSTNYFLEPYDAYSGGYIPALNQIITTDAAGKANFSITLNNSIDKINKQYPDYAYRLTWIDPTYPQRLALINEASRASVAPNPTTGVVTVTANADLISSIEMYDPMGKLLFKIQDINEKTKQVGLAAWKGQVITLKIRDVKGNCSVHRCVVMAN